MSLNSGSQKESPVPLTYSHETDRSEYARSNPRPHGTTISHIAREMQLDGDMGVSGSNRWARVVESGYGDDSEEIMVPMAAMSLSTMYLFSRNIQLLEACRVIKADM